MTQQLTTTARWSYRVERTDAEPERACLAYGHRDLGPGWDDRSFAEEIARENRYTHSYYHGGLKVTVWQGNAQERRAQRTGECPADAEVFSFGVVEGGNATAQSPRSVPVGSASALTGASGEAPLPGDAITVHFEATSSTEPFSECYTVVEVDDGTVFTFGVVEGGRFAGPDFADPGADLWVEAGPEQLTIERAGRLVHNGLGGVR